MLNYLYTWPGDNSTYKQVQLRWQSCMQLWQASGRTGWKPWLCCIKSAGSLRIWWWFLACSYGTAPCRHPAPASALVEELCDVIPGFADTALYEGTRVVYARKAQVCVNWHCQWEQVLCPEVLSLRYLTAMPNTFAIPSAVTVGFETASAASGRVHWC
jgi:hypothetical protein